MRCKLLKKLRKEANKKYRRDDCVIQVYHQFPLFHLGTNLMPGWSDCDSAGNPLEAYKLLREYQRNFILEEVKWRRIWCGSHVIS